MPEVHALIPDHLGLSVVEVHQLIAYLDDGQDLDDAITNAGIDTLMVSPRNTPEQRWNTLESLVERVRALNETGDGAAYWNAEG
jgi:hypothetical protein